MLERGAEVLPGFGYDSGQIDVVTEIIGATRLPQSPRSILGQLMADADLDVLGRRDFAVKNDALRLELARFGDVVDPERWCVEQLEFLRGHTYFTTVANELRGRGKQANIADMERRLAQLRNPT